MKTLWREGVDDGIAVVALKPGKVISPWAVPIEGTERYFVRRGKDLIALKDIVAVLETFGRSLKVKYLRFVREDRKPEGAKGLHKMKPIIWPRLRVACRHAGKPRLHAWGGFDLYVVGYRDEIAVADYGLNGAHGWIVRRGKEVEDLLNSLPPLQDSGETARFFVESVGFMNTPDEFSARVLAVNPLEEGLEPLKVYSPPFGAYVSYNRRVYAVEYDTGSLRVKRILNLITGNEVEAVGYKTQPVPRGIKKGERIPKGLLSLYGIPEPAR